MLLWDERTCACVCELRGEHKDVIKAMVLVGGDNSVAAAGAGAAAAAPLSVWTGGGDVDKTICVWSL